MQPLTGDRPKSNCLSGMNNLCVIVVLFTLAMTARTVADEPGIQLTYDFFHGLVKSTSTDSEKVLTITSAIDGVRNENIVLTIHSEKLGALHVHLDTSGQLIDFPLMAELLDENPLITHNQSPASVHIHFQFRLPQDSEMTELLQEHIARGLLMDKNRIKYSALVSLSSQRLTFAMHTEGCTHDHGQKQHPVLQLRYTAPGKDHLHLLTMDRNNHLHPEDGIFTIVPPKGDCSFDPWIRFCPKLKPSWEIKDRSGKWVSIVSLVEAFQSAIQPGQVNPINEQQ